MAAGVKTTAGGREVGTRVTCCELSKEKLGIGGEENAQDSTRPPGGFRHRGA